MLVGGASPIASESRGLAKNKATLPFSLQKEGNLPVSPPFIHAQSRLNLHVTNTLKNQEMLGM